MVNTGKVAISSAYLLEGCNKLRIAFLLLFLLVG
jgi:hypothetical protein